MKETTLRLKFKTRDRLSLLKKHPRQSFDELLNDLAEEKEKQNECTNKTNC